MNIIHTFFRSSVLVYIFFFANFADFDRSVCREKERKKGKKISDDRTDRKNVV